jgi:PAP2 superfamily
MGTTSFGSRVVGRRLIGAAALGFALVAVVTTAQATSGTSRTSATAPQRCLASPASPASTGNAVVDWNAIAQNAIVIGRPPGSSAVLEGIVQAAVYDAAVAVEGRYEPFVASPAVFGGPASTAAAVAKAACEVLVARVPGQATSVEDQYAHYLAAITDGPAKENGVAVGAQVANAILDWRAGDGFDNVIPWSQPPPGPGVFEPVPPEVLPPPTPVDVKLKQVRPLTLTSNSQFRPDGPNPLTSAEYAKDFNEVKAYGRVDSVVRTPQQTQTALFWSENSALQWPRNLRKLALEKRLDLADTARMLALTQVATADAILACFDAKYHYLAWRPVHAIRRADTDGNPATDPDPTWTPLLVVNHPEYPGAHGCWSTAVTKMLATFFGTDKIDFSVDSTVPGAGPTRYYRRFKDATKEVYDARTWAGLHFRNSTMEGAWIGRKVARYVAKNFFVPTAE